MPIAEKQAEGRKIMRFILGSVQEPQEEAMKLIGEIRDAIGGEDRGRARALMARLVELHPELKFLNEEED